MNLFYYINALNNVDHKVEFDNDSCIIRLYEYNKVIKAKTFLDAVIEAVKVKNNFKNEN